MTLVRLFTMTSFLSAALLFMVQPLFAKLLLPLLGGTPAVWNTCQMFFQIALLAGYGYAHLLTTRCSARTQGIVHAVVVVLAGVVSVPIQLPVGWSPPGEASPLGWLLVVLAVSVGAPFFALSATAPLLQRWLSHSRDRSAHDPYFLYAASNLGSMGILLAYPFVLEPLLRLRQQSVAWGVGYGGFAVAMLVCCLARTRCRASPTELVHDSDAVHEHEAVPVMRVRFNALPPTWSQRMIWLLLAFIPSSWMLGVTTHLTTDLSPVPLLWIVPLTGYLLTFVIVFSRRPLLPHGLMRTLFPVGLVSLAAATAFSELWTQIAVHLVAFGLGAMVCHGELARRRPTAAHLTEFYFWMSLGGCGGGVLHALVAPVLFPLAFEYPLTVALACLFVGFGRHDGDEADFDGPARAPDRERSAKVRRTEASRSASSPHDKADSRLSGPGAIRTGVVLLSAAVAGLMWLCLPMTGTPNAVTWVMLGVPVLLVLLWIDIPKVFALLVTVLLVARQIEPPIEGDVLFTGRSFFGIHRVVRRNNAHQHQLVHGATVHGIQSLLPDRRCEPLAYYHPSGPLGDVFATLRDHPTGRRVALIGLGAGATVSYAEPGRRFTLYEIDPVVKRIAESPDLFRYLSDCGRDSYDIVLGDGRLKLREAASRAYGLIIFDAFSSDAIPLHLLTREAFEIYLTKLDDRGWLVFHVSNLHLDLVPVLADLAADRGLTGFVRRDLALSDAAFAAGKSPSTYVVLARDRSHLLGLPQLRDWSDTASQAKGVVWTDDYANVLSTLKW